MVEVINNTSTAITANTAIPFTQQTFDTNNKISFDSTTNAIVISKIGQYEINGSFVFSPTSATGVTIQAYANGVAIPSALATNTTTANGTYTFTLPSKFIKVIPSTRGNTVSITFQANAVGTLTNAVASVQYVE